MIAATDQADHAQDYESPPHLFLPTFEDRENAERRERFLACLSERYRVTCLCAQLLSQSRKRRAPCCNVRKLGAGSNDGIAPQRSKARRWRELCARAANLRAQLIGHFARSA